MTATDSSITTGQTVQATVVARDAANNILSLTGRAVSWSSSATGVATVNGAGLVTAVSAGTATISVTVDGVGPASFLLTVAPPSVATVSVTAPDSSVTAGDVLQATVVARDAGGNALSLGGRQVNWSSSASRRGDDFGHRTDHDAGARHHHDRRHRRRRGTGDLRVERRGGARGDGERLGH